MELGELRNLLASHSGTFLCVEIGNDTNTKEVPFVHVASTPGEMPEIFQVPSVGSFYATFSRLRLYHDATSGEAAFELAPPEEWSPLDERFYSWIDGTVPSEMLPDWIDDRIVIGSVPGSGNYLMVATAGEKRGCVFKFDHDGFIFRELASSIEEFVLSALDPSPELLTSIATHMRFVENDNWAVQWWIQAMSDNRGNVVNTE